MFAILPRPIVCFLSTDEHGGSRALSHRCRDDHIVLLSVANVVDNKGFLRLNQPCILGHDVLIFIH